MAKSSVFYTNSHKRIERKIIATLNSEPDYLSARTMNSTRAAGDAVQDILASHFEGILGDICHEYSSSFARRAMADFAFRDCDDFYYVVDVKTHRIGTAFNMPNLTSVERLSRFYEDDKNYFTILMVKYQTEETRVTVRKVHFIPIEFLAWECLTVGALGWGQIQISNANFITVKERQSRKAWMLQLCDIMLDFYPREITKINKRIGYFKELRKKWGMRPES